MVQFLGQLVRRQPDALQRDRVGGVGGGVAAHGRQQQQAAAQRRRQQKRREGPGERRASARRCGMTRPKRRRAAEQVTRRRADAAPLARSVVIPSPFKYAADYCRTPSAQSTVDGSPAGRRGALVRIRDDPVRTRRKLGRKTIWRR